MDSLSEPATSVGPSISSELMGKDDCGIIQVVSMAPRATSLLSHTVILAPVGTFFFFLEKFKDRSIIYEDNYMRFLYHKIHMIL